MLYRVTPLAGVETKYVEGFRVLVCWLVVVVECGWLLADGDGGSWLMVANCWWIVG